MTAEYVDYPCKCREIQDTRHRLLSESDGWSKLVCTMCGSVKFSKGRKLT